MSANKQLNTLITQVENHIECWKQFNHFINLARGKKFGPAEENQFLEVKSVIVQELELIFASIEIGSPSREEIHALIGNTSSLQYLSEVGNGAVRGIENQWHRIYIGWHAILGQLKVRQQAAESKTLFLRGK